MSQKRAYIFDFDETLVLTKAKIYVYRDKVFIKSMNSKEYNFYKPNPKDKLDFSEFKDPELILNAKKYKMWPVLKNVSDAIKEDRSSSAIYILTARAPIVKSYIYEFLKKNGIDISIDHIITIGDDAGKIIISDEKRKELKKLASLYEDVIFFDDDPKNIAIAKAIPGIRTRLVESLNESSFATLSLSELLKLKKQYIKWFEEYKLKRKEQPKRNWLGREIKINSNQFRSLKDEYHKLLTEIAKKYHKIMKTNEEMGGIGTPMATPMNVPGVGNATPASGSHLGSGDKFSSVRKPYTQTGKLKKKKKKIVKEDLNEVFEMTTLLASIGALLTFSYVFKLAWKNIKEHKKVKEIVRKLAQEPEIIQLTKKRFNYNRNQLRKIFSKYLTIEEQKYLNDFNKYEIDREVNRLKEAANINPYDKIGVAMAKKMGIKPPFKKKKSKGNQNAMIQQKFEHQIITLDEFTKILNEGEHLLHDARQEWKDMMKRDKKSLLSEFSQYYRIHALTEKDSKYDIICAILDAKYTHWSAEPKDFMNK